MLKDSKVQLLSHVQLFVTTWTAARQASLSTTNFQSLLKLMSIELVMPPSKSQSRFLILTLLQSFWSRRAFYSLRSVGKNTAKR